MVEEKEDASVIAEETYDNDHHHLFYVRHGERVDHAKHLKIEYPIKYDPPLTPLGVQQATETGRFFKEYLKTHKFDDIVIECSPFIRTMMTGAAIAKEIGFSQITVNHHFCEWMSDNFFDWNHLPELMVRNPDIYPKENIIKEYLGGIGYVDEDKGYEESLTYYPESKDNCYDRNQRLIQHVCEGYEGSKDKRVLHIIVTHGYHVESMGI